MFDTPDSQTLPRKSPKVITTNDGRKVHVFDYTPEFGFSNWCFSLIEHPDYEELYFNCAQQLYSWDKARYFGDKDMQKLILMSDEPHVQQRLGQCVRPYYEGEWRGDQICETVRFLNFFFLFSA